MSQGTYACDDQLCDGGCGTPVARAGPPLRQVPHYLLPLPDTFRVMFGTEAPPGEVWFPHANSYLFCKDCTPIIRGELLSILPRSKKT